LWQWLVLLAVCGCSGPAHTAFAIGQPPYVENVSTPGSFPIVSQSNAAGIYADTNDWPGVLRAVNDLRADVMRVTGCRPRIISSANEAGTNVIIVGTIGKSRIIDRLIHEGKVDVSPVLGKRESFLIKVVPAPLPGLAMGLVIAGSDKRGTIYGIYDLSEQMGVSPWYWWTDVPTRHQDELFVRPGLYVQGPPAVQYRGIFLNDEAPDLTGWAKEKFGDYNHGFYTNVFELLLRLKANYLWPAMWNNCFNEDDPLNPKLADEYGIVMGTSHVEPMMRADKEWNRAGYTASQWNYDKYPGELDKFWKAGIERNKPYENLITIAMRGKIDTPMSETANIALLEKIVAAQRQIIADVMQTNVAAVPQLWALYKEVQEYYEKGMRVPDDVLLLWCDDNWGNVRRLPTPEERNRAGGAGVYYHFDYVGGPRNYKWLNTVPITKVWDQMNLAYRYGADRLWIVNVGHLQHVTFPMEFFLTLARNPDQWPKERIADYTQSWAQREFGSRHAQEIADLMAKYTKYNGRRKPELLEPGTFSLVNYREADTVLADWKSLAEQAERVYEQLPTTARDAYFELVLYPIRACANLNELYIATAKNHLYAEQGRASANDFADRVRTAFEEDATLAGFYNHTLAGGKWNHMMDQTHIGYTGWQQPPKNNMPNVTEIEIPGPAAMGVAIEGSASAWPGSPDAPALPQFDVFNQPRYSIDVFNRGKTPFEFSALASAPWIRLNPPRGRVEKEQRIEVSVDWNQAPAGLATGSVRISGAGTNTVTVGVEAFNPSQPTRDSVQGFVEANGHVSIEAEHYSRKTDAGEVRWEKIADYGRTLSSMTLFPMTAKSVMPPENSPCLEYPVYLFSTGRVEVVSIIAPTLNFVPDRGLRFAVSFDDEPPQILTAVPKGFFVDNGNRNWEESVKDNGREIKSAHILHEPGLHTLKIWMVDPAVVLEKIVIDTGGLKPSYLGPPESFRRPIVSSAGSK
jgi:hypothetical protein